MTDLPTHSSYPLRRTAALVFLLFLSACAAGTHEAGEGSAIAEAQWSGYKCRAIAQWLTPFVQQYPSLVLNDRPPQVANLFRDNSFTPVFGYTYSVTNAPRLTSLHNNLITSCIAKDSDALDQNFLETYKEFFAKTFKNFDPAIAQRAADYTQRAQWMLQALDQLHTIPADNTGLTRLDQEFTAAGHVVLTPLWPAEQQRFDDAIAQKRAAIIARLTPGSLPPTTTEPPPPSQQPTLAERIAPRRQALEAIPLTVEGRAQSAAWITEFEREFYAYNGSKEAAEARAAWSARREEIFRATKGDFTARLALIPKGPDAPAAYDAILNETFPLRSDRSMAAYRVYRAEITARQEPFLKRAYQSTVDGITSIGNWLSEAAHKVVHGSGNNKSR